MNAKQTKQVEKQFSKGIAKAINILDKEVQEWMIEKYNFSKPQYKKVKSRLAQALVQNIAPQIASCISETLVDIATQQNQVAITKQQNKTSNK